MLGRNRQNVAGLFCGEKGTPRKFSNTFGVPVDSYTWDPLITGDELYL